MNKMLFFIVSIFAGAGIFVTDYSAAGTAVSRHGTLEVSTVDSQGAYLTTSITVRKGKKTVAQGSDGILQATLSSGTYAVTFGDFPGYSLKDPKAGMKTARVKPGKTTKVTAVYAAVSGSSSGEKSKYVDNGDGTVTDNVNNLMWQQAASAEYYNWYGSAGVYDATANPDSIDACGPLALAGYSDWRLPTIDELKTLIKEDATPKIDTAFFPRAADEAYMTYWSTTPLQSSTTCAWYINFNFGSVINSNKQYGDHVLCVREVK